MLFARALSKAFPLWSINEKRGHLPSTTQRRARESSGFSDTLGTVLCVCDSPWATGHDTAPFTTGPGGDACLERSTVAPAASAASVPKAALDAPVPLGCSRAWGTHSG